MKEKKDGQPHDYSRIIYAILVVFILVCFTVAGFFNDAEQKLKAEENKPVPVTVYVSGEVVNPGIYEIDKNARVADAVELAGGFTENADTTKVNLAKRIKDGAQINVPPVNSEN